MLTKGAIGNLVNRYNAVLKKCHLINTFSSLAVAAMLVMGAAAGEAFGQFIGYDVTSPSSTGPTVSGTDVSTEADARGINAFAEGNHIVPDTITRAEATATGTQGARSFGVLSESNTGNSLTVQLGSLDISSQAVTEDGEGRSFGIYSYDNSTVTMKGGSVTSSAESQNGDSTVYGIFSGESSHVTSGAGSVTAFSSSGGSDAWVYSYGIQADGSSSFTATNPLTKIEASATSREKASQLFAYGINAESDSAVTLNNADITVQTKTDHQLDYNNAYGVSLGGDSIFRMRDGSIRVAATDISGKAFTGDAVGIMTNSGGDSYTISLGTVDIQAEGKGASGLALAHATMDMAGGSITAKAHGGQAQGLNANGETTFTATGDINFTAQAEGSKAVALHAEGESVITALGGAVIASGDKTAYDPMGAVGLEASSGSSITKSGGDVTVSSLTGHAVGLDAQDNSHPDKTYRASRIAYGNADATTRVKVEGMEKAYGIRARNLNVTTSDGKSASVELTNGDIRVTAGSSDAYGAYSDSGNIALKGTTAITAAAETSGGEVYSLYAKGNKPSAINVERASVIEGDMATETSNASVTAVFQDGGKMKGWTRSLGKLELTFGKNAVWEMVSSNNLAKGNDGNYAANLTKLALDDAHVYVGNTQGQWEAGPGFSSSKALLSATDAPAKLKIGTLSGSGHFYLRTDMEKDISDSVHVTDGLSGNHALHVQASGAKPVETQTASYLARAEQQVGAASGAFALKGGRNVNGQELIDIGLYNYTLATSERNNGREWYLTRVELPDPEDPSKPGGGDTPLSPTGEAEAALSGLAGHYALWYGQQTDLRKRLGEVRYGTQTGLWVRGFADKSRLDGLGGTSFTQNLVGGSIGYDTLVSEDEEYRWLVGMQLRSGRAHQSVNGRWGGYGDLTGVGGGLYSTWAHADGWYVDAAATMDWYNHKIRATMMDGTRVHDDRSSYGLGASLEAGRKIDFGFSNEGRDHWFVEPQAQLSYFWVKGGDFTASNGMKIDQKDMDSLTGRAGLVLGKKFALNGGNGSRYIQPYVKAGLNHEFLGEQEARLNGVRMTSDLEGTRGYYGVGVDWQATDNLRLYMQAEREHGEHFTREYNVSAGLKWTF